MSEESPCDECPVDRILTYCCKSNPVTRESKELELEDGTIRSACPDFFVDDEGVGYCGIYLQRPWECRSYDCHIQREETLLREFGIEGLDY